MVYEWQCLDCGEVVETNVPMAESSTPPGDRCPMCAGDRWEKLLTGGLGFVLKGQGWERDGYELKSDSQALQDKLTKRGK